VYPGTHSVPSRSLPAVTSLRLRSAGIGSGIRRRPCDLRASAARAGFTLVETLIAIVVVSLLSLMAYPRFHEAMATTNLRSARSKVAGLYAKTRAVAIESSRTATLRIEGGRAYVVAQPRRKPGAGQIDTITPPENLYTQYGVSLAPDIDIRVAPTGLGLDAATLILTKESHVDTISISRFGQVLK
jgi:prepilin-type N-terminal cleavage/methylation domain-containing protein